MAIYADCESKRRARLKWRKSRKGQWWDHLYNKEYNKRPEVKARLRERYIQRKINGTV